MKTIITGDWNGLPIWREETAGDRLNQIIHENKMTKENQIEQEERFFDTVEELDAEYYKTHDCISDDVDAEQGRIERWADQMGYQVR